MVIDADAGVDDAQAILMALAYPNELDVVAITTVHGNSSCKNVTCNVLRLLQVAKRLDVRLLMILLLVIMLFLVSILGISVFILRSGV